MNSAAVFPVLARKHYDKLVCAMSDEECQCKIHFFYFVIPPNADFRLDTSMQERHSQCKVYKHHFCFSNTAASIMPHVESSPEPLLKVIPT